LPDAIRRGGIASLCACLEAFSSRNGSSKEQLQHKVYLVWQLDEQMLDGYAYIARRLLDRQPEAEFRAAAPLPSPHKLQNPRTQ
jgi:hypothetical protein